jgi:NitT/TauT family transport system ATP-binding protein
MFSGGRMVMEVPGTVSQNGPTGPVIKVDGLRVVRGKSGPNPITIVDGVSLAASRGERLAIVGPSGCGKTISLNVIAGLETFTSGSVSVNGELPRPGQAGVSYAFARDALLPWRTAVQNVELSLEIRGTGHRKERRALAMEALERVHLADFAGAYRAQLSQGMRQRVALARTFVTKPSVLLLDEPFAALDAHTRIAMADMLAELLEQVRCTVVLVTHDVAEAIAIADRVVVFSSRPARVLREYDTGFDQAKSGTQLRGERQFQELYAEIVNQLPGGGLAR